MKTHVVATLSQVKRPSTWDLKQSPIESVELWKASMAALYTQESDADSSKPPQDLGVTESLMTPKLRWSGHHTLAELGLPRWQNYELARAPPTLHCRKKWATLSRRICCYRALKPPEVRLPRGRNPQPLRQVQLLRRCFCLAARAHCGSGFRASAFGG